MLTRHHITRSIVVVTALIGCALVFSSMAHASRIWTVPGADKTNLGRENSAGGPKAGVLDLHAGAQGPSLIVLDNVRETALRFFFDGRPVERIVPENVQLRGPRSVAVMPNGDVVLVANARVYLVSPKDGSMTALAGHDRDTHLVGVGNVRIQPKNVAVMWDGTILVGGTRADDPFGGFYHGQPNFVWKLSRSPDGVSELTLLMGGGNIDPKKPEAIGQPGTVIEISDHLTSLITTRNGGFAFATMLDSNLHEAQPDGAGTFRLKPPVNREGWRVSSLAETRDGSLLVGDETNHRVYKVSPLRDSIVEIAGGDKKPVDGMSAKDAYVYPDGVIPSPDGGFFIVDSLFGAVRYVSPEDRLETEINGLVETAKADPKAVEPARKRLTEIAQSSKDPVELSNALEAINNNPQTRYENYLGLGRLPRELQQELHQITMLRAFDGLRARIALQNLPR